MRSLTAWLVLLSALAGHHELERASCQPLSTSSRWIVDERGRRVKLACVNWPSHLEPVLAEGLSKRAVGAIAGDVAAMGFDCVRLTWPTFLVTNASYSSLTVAESLQRLNLSESLAGVSANNPGVLDLTLIDAFKAVVKSLGESDLMVILDNHVSKPGWCCSKDDGNGFFRDKYFDPDDWVDGLTEMARMFAGEPNVVGMSLRNELRGPRQNVDDWYEYMQRGAEAVHAANPGVLVILSGLSFDNDLSFLKSKPVNFSFVGKTAFEVHWYSMSNTQDWRDGNPNDVCARVAAGVSRRALYLLDEGWPVFLSEFGADNTGRTLANSRYWGCVAAVAMEMDLDWAIWGLQGSYYTRGGVEGDDENYGLLDRDWTEPRNDTALRRVQGLQRPFRGPGLDEAAPPYNVLFHPVTGRCVVRQQLEMMTEMLELGTCDETAAWAYTPEQRLELRDGGSSSLLCLRADGAGLPASLGVGRAGCAGEMARWRLVSESKLHVAVNLTSSSSEDSQNMLCLDVRADGQSVVTVPCRCLSGDKRCDPESQWFKLVNSTRTMPALP